MCIYNCHSKGNEDFLINLVKQSKKTKYLSYENIEILEEILDNKEFKGYSIIDNIIKKSKINFFDNLKTQKDNNPILYAFWIDENVKSQENKKYIETFQKEFSKIHLIGMKDMKNLD